ncbi:Rne/Rng family ribonuclease [Gordonia desulfuricans]|uniref:Ribonuclease E n=1 Tax=Gordonia desulfuricans TaxID=89051 RepID=A0A7K3LVT4_9ACTN|nr:translation initiation factor IF-2 N-terminal domain-containing protein [Gordonia desulfuricans]NDK91657.1 Rne/Rng family ribonuclease [Gordonia desulfuricans]
MTDNGSPADANAASDPVEEEFPNKLRVHALARALGLTSRQVIAHLAELGWHLRSPQSSVERAQANAVAKLVREPQPEIDENAEASENADAAPAAAGEPEVPAPAAPEPATEAVADSVGAAAVPAEPVPDTVEEIVVAETVVEEVVTDQAPAPETVVAEAPVTASAQEPAAEDVPADQTPVDETPADAAPEADAPAESIAAEAETPVTEPPVTETPVEAADTASAEAAPARPKIDSVLFSAVETVSHEPVSPVGEVVAGPLFLQPQLTEPPARPRKATVEPAPEAPAAETDSSEQVTETEPEADSASVAGETADDDQHGESGRRRRRRGRRGRGRGRGDQSERDDSDDETDSESQAESESLESTGSDAAGDDSKDAESKDSDSAGTDAKDGDSGSGRGRRRRGSQHGEHTTEDNTADDSDEDGSDDESGSDDDDASVPTSKRRRRRRRRKGGDEPDEVSPDDPPNTVVHEREPRSKRVRDEVQGISGSTRLEAKRQRRRDGRDAGRRRPPILSESEFLARREAVERVMVVRERSANVALNHGDHTDHTPIEDYTQVAVLEDGVLVEHFVTTETSSSMVGNIYLGRVQNVLPGMEAAFVDIGRGRNGVLYAGEVNWDAAGLDGGSRKIEQALSPGDNVVVQVSKDPVGHKGARLTTQISLAGRYLVYVPGGSSTGISRKLPDVERKRLKQILSKLVPDNAGVIIRTASEGVSADDLAADIERLENKWEGIEESVAEAKKAKGSVSPRALYEEPDLLVRVVRDLFNEDFRKLVIEGDRAWNLVETYVSAVAPDLLERVEKFERAHADSPDSFVVHRVDEQLAKALDRKVWLPSGGTLIIEHTEAMTVIDVNTGKFTGSGGNLEETVTRNNLEAAEEIVRQMRLRDLGGMIIVDFIDMVLESNRDLVLRRLTEALARDRTRHQVSEVTSLGLVQMTRKRLGTGLLEAFSTTCTACGGRGVIVHSSPVEVRSDDNTRGEGSGSKRSRRGKRKSEPAVVEQAPAPKATQHRGEHPMFRAMAAHSHPDGEHEEHDHDGHDHDEHIDVAHADQAHADQAHEDQAHEDQAHEDQARQDRSRRDRTQRDRTQRDRTQRDRTQRDQAQRDRTQQDQSATVPAERGRTEPADDEHVSAETPVAETPVAETPVTETPAVQVTESPAAESQEPTPAPEQETATRRPRRRRAARRAASSPTHTSEVSTLTLPDVAAEPLTTFGPTTSSSNGETTVAVHRRPRRRAAGRPAGPPVEE